MVTRAIEMVVLGALAAIGSGCAVKTYAINMVGNVLASGGFASAASDQVWCTIAWYARKASSAALACDRWSG